jgi:glucose/mannose-6-phosphate isomerase
VPHQLDTQDMENVILQSPSQFAAGLEAAMAVDMTAKRVDRLLVVGMGGSWIPAALVRDTDLSSIPISIHRNYGLPKDVKRVGTLVCALSYSGNTEETLSAYEGCHWLESPRGVSWKPDAFVTASRLSRSQPSRRQCSPATLRDTPLAF